MATKLAEWIKTQTQDSRVQSAIPKLPGYLVQRFKEVARLQEELDTLQMTLRNKGGNFLGLGRQMTSSQKRTHQERIGIIDVQLQGLERIAKAVRLGYEPYKVPEKWFAGYAAILSWRDLWSHDLRARDGERLEWEFQAPMPENVIEKHEKAKKTGLFDEFIVAAPDASLFRSVRSLYAEPALIGYIATEPGRVLFSQPVDRKPGYYPVVKPGLMVEGGAGFLIAMWDLEKDREFAGI